MPSLLWKLDSHIIQILGEKLGFFELTCHNKVIAFYKAFPHLQSSSKSLMVFASDPVFFWREGMTHIYLAEVTHLKCDFQKLHNFTFLFTYSQTIKGDNLIFVL